MTQRAANKKLRSKIRVGSVVTWGNGAWSHRVIEVRDTGIVVDATSAGFPTVFVSFLPGRPQRPPGISLADAGPPRLSTMPPDKPPK